MLNLQRAAFRAEGVVSARTRVDRLDRLARMLRENEGRIAEVVESDFGCRHRDFSRYAEVASSLKMIRHARRSLRSGMRIERRRLEFPLGLLGAQGRVQWVPKGVVGVISPWNYPVYLAIAPLADVLAAGNRAMLKPSEHTPRTSELLAELIRDFFDPAELAVCPGGSEVGRAFSRLPFDHIVFTGGAEVGRLVMRAASENLVPVTLELGGKSPAIVGRSARLGRAAESVVLGKLINSGQMCTAVDYAFVPREQLDEFVAMAGDLIARMYPSLADNPDYASVISDRHFQRLLELVEEARRRGARVVEINPAGEDLSVNGLRKLAPTIILNPDDDLRVMVEEVFGPVLPIRAYGLIDEVIEYVNDHGRPLALYYFGRDRSERNRVLARTMPGGVTINEVIAHAVMENLPFGGVGSSGMGVYHGLDGFREFSHRRACMKAPRVSMWRLLGMRPPYGKQLRRILKWELRA
jgi:coniferyl-aldehyde dehydrogenase